MAVAVDAYLLARDEPLEAGIVVHENCSAIESFEKTPIG